jgi:hypothetical protein
LRVAGSSADGPLILREAIAYLNEKGDIISGSESGGFLREEDSQPSWELVGKTYIHEIKIYEGEIGKDIVEGKVVLEDFTSIYQEWCLICGRPKREYSHLSRRI